MEIRADTSTGFAIACAPMLFRAASVIFASALRAADDARMLMFANLGMNDFNVLLNFLLVYPARGGIFRRVVRRARRWLSSPRLRLAARS